jgi:hypothetical protein
MREHGDTETRGRGDAETGRHCDRDAETMVEPSAAQKPIYENLRRNADLSVSPSLPVPVSPSLPVPVSPRLRVASSPRPRFSASPRLRVASSPCPLIPPFPDP